MNPVHNQLDIVVCDNPQDAIDRGFDHSKNGTKPIEVKKVVVVKNGTQAGRSTVDFVLRDEHGNEYVFLVTNQLLAMAVNLGS